MSNKKPVHEVRLGNVQAAIWENKGTTGVYYNVTLQRYYRGDDNQWKSTGSFGRDDLPLVAKVADMSLAWICDQSQHSIDSILPKVY